MANLTSPPATASKLRELLAKDDIVVCPGIYDGFTARIWLNTRFKTLYMVFHICQSKQIRIEN
jgi:2-methylisocitrate lyase-like PEP mutase family enzyme